MYHTSLPEHKIFLNWLQQFNDLSISLAKIVNLEVVLSELELDCFLVLLQNPMFMCMQFPQQRKCGCCGSVSIPFQGASQMKPHD